MLLYCTKGEKKKKKGELLGKTHRQILQYKSSRCNSESPTGRPQNETENFFFFGIEKALTVNMRMIKTMLSHCFPLFIYQFVISWSCNQIVKPLGWRPTSCTVFAEAMPTAALIFQ